MRACFYRSLVSLLLLGVAHAQTPAGNKADAAAPAPTPAKPAPPLRVAVDPHAPPLIFKTGEKYSGLEAEFARGLGEALGRPAVFVEASGNDLIQALLDDKADLVMSGMAINRLRLVRVAFCNPYLRIGQVALCRRADLSTYSNNANLQNLRTDIGVVTGSTGDVFVGSQFTYAIRKAFPTPAEAVAALLDKRVGLVITDFPAALWQSSSNEANVAVVPNLLTQDDLAWAVRKDDDALRQAANVYLEKLRTDKKLTELVHKWVPDAAPETVAPGAPPLAAPTPEPGKK